MDSRFENDILTLAPEGHIDTANAAAVEDEINAARAEHPGCPLVLDFDKITYISSVGLRILLRLKKAGQEVSVINVSSEVYDIFDMTGFTEMLSITKGYRKLSVDGCEVIGEGSNGIVYRYSEDIIIKVYKNNDALNDIKRERELARTALVMGVNTAIPYDVVKVGDKYGSVFELLSAKSLTRLIIDDPDNRSHYVRIFADMLRDIHSTEVTSAALPKISDVYMNYTLTLKGQLDDAHYEKLRSLIAAVPDTNRMIHGDYHTNNVHYANNEAILIDMDTLAVGNPIFELASVYLAYRGFNELDPTSSLKFLKLDADTARQIYDELLRFYFGTEDMAEIEKYEDRIRTLAYTRLLRRTMRRQSELTDKIQEMTEKLTALIDRVDDLAIYPAL